MRSDSEAIIRSLERLNIMSTVTITWTSGGNAVVFSASKGANEAPDVFAARAKAEYEAMLEAFPKDA